MTLEIIAGILIVSFLSFLWAVIVYQTIEDIFLYITKDMDRREIVLDALNIGDDEEFH